MRLPGLSAPVEVRFDAIGIPHASAASEEDAYRALGWLHASDRLFQMEARRRAAAGRLAEIAGEAALPLDIEARTLGLERLAKAELDILPAGVRRALEAYAGGVNAYLERQPLPLEFLLLRIEPEPWTPLDSLAFQWLMYSRLSDALVVERSRVGLAERLGLEGVAQFLDATYGTPTLVPAPLARAFPGPPTRPAVANASAAASNAWALSGRRTASGRPLLATDPHLPAEYPGVWYAAHLSSRDGLQVAGLTLAGLPGVVIGHNGRLAWGITMHQADDADYFIEELDPAGDRYRDAEGWRPFDEREERVRVRHGLGIARKEVEEVRVRVRATRHGPLLAGEEAPSMGPAERGQGPLVSAVAWAPAMVLGSLEAFALAARAAGRDDFEAAWRRYGGPALNVCWATSDGHIGVRASGAVPKRLRGDGRLPAPGWTGEFDWEGLLPASELPSIEDPPEAFVATANDDWSAAGFRLPYPGLFAGRERVDRIRDVLAAVDSARVETMRDLQSDVVSLYARRVIAALGALELRETSAVRAREILSRWDGRIERLGPARLFHEFVSELHARTFGPRERRLGARLPASWELLARMIEGAAGADLWDDPETETRERRDSLVGAALASALARVESEEGSEPSRWSWGRVHALSYEHPLLGGVRLPVLRRVGGTGPIELPGDVHTVSVAGFPLGSGTFGVRHIASARLIVDLADPDASRIVLPIGQSGQLGDRHRRDQLRAWSEGRDFPLPFSRAAVERAAVSILRLVP